MDNNYCEADHASNALACGCLNLSGRIIDDGRFLIEHNDKYPLNEGNGVMRSRRVEDQLSPGVLPVIGEYGMTSDGLWKSSIKAGHVDAAFGPFESRNDAIAAIWLARFDV